MSILIKGLNMPKDIASNVHRTITLIISGDGTIYDVDRNQLPYEAVEIKETHGQLIDIDKIFNALRISKDIDNESKAKFMGLLIESPTVIEAEEQEHE